MYIGYVIIMNHSTRLEARVKAWLGEEVPVPPEDWVNDKIGNILRQHELPEYEVSAAQRWRTKGDGGG